MAASATPDTTVVTFPLSQMDAKERTQYRKLFTERGWLFVRLPEHLAGLTAAAAPVVEKFLHGKDCKAQSAFSFPPGFGFYAGKHKVGLRLVTGEHLAKTPLPPSIQEPVRALCTALDEIMASILVDKEQPLFPMQDPAAAIPLVHGDEHGQRYGMFDAVLYDSTDLKRDLLITPHIDPGLVSLSLMASAPGLQLLDTATQTWVPVPDGVAVLWSGATAQNVDGTAGAWHRVEPKSHLRFTMWYEVCIAMQVPRSIRDNGMLPAKDAAAAAAAVTAAAADEEKGKPMTVHVMLQDGDAIDVTVDSMCTVQKLKTLVDDMVGHPFSKSLTVRSAPGMLSDPHTGFGMAMENDSKLVDCGVGDGSVVVLIGPEPRGVGRPVLGKKK